MCGLVHDQKDEVRRLWAQVVQDDDFLKGVVSAIRIRKGMDENALKSHIAYSAGANKSTHTTTGCGTIIEVLREADAVREEDGKLVAHFSAQPAAPSTDQDNSGGPATALQDSNGLETGNLTNIASIVHTPTTLSKGSGGLAISINIDVACDAADLDTLGKKLRQIIEDLNENTSDKDIGETAD